jgi:hypothetical protein
MSEQVTVPDEAKQSWYHDKRVKMLTESGAAQDAETKRGELTHNATRVRRG